MNPAVTIENLSFAYRGSVRPALRDVCGQMEKGSFIVIMGHGGAGKSTLCCSLNGLVPHFFRGEYKGSVFIHALEAAKQRVAKMSLAVGLVFQDFEAQLFSTNVELEMAFGPENHAVPRPEIERRIRRYLNFVGLEKHRHREPASLSGGEKQRLAIGSVLSMEPSLLVMDEATTDLDPKGREEVLSLAERIREEERMLLIVDHEPETAQGADQIWLMKDGEFIAQGPPGQLLPDLPRLKSCGVKPHPTIELFAAMEWPGTPFTVESAISLIEKHHLAQPRRPTTGLPSPTAAKGAPLLQAKEVRYAYPSHEMEALRGIDLSIFEGEFIAILGQNGSGKTTLAKQFNGLLKPASGQVSLQGRPTSSYSRTELARRVGYVFQNPDHQIFARTVREEVGFSLKVFGEDPKGIDRRVAEALDTVGLEGYEDRVPFTLTKGERQRVAVASVLATQPQVIILDEPTTGLDYLHQRNIMELLKRLNEQHHTIIIITHSMWVAAEYTKRTLVLKEGKILMDGPTRSVFADEARLSEASLKLPPLVRLSNWLGTRGMTLEEMVKELNRIG